MFIVYRTFIVLLSAVTLQPAVSAAPAEKPRLGANITKPVECLPTPEAEAQAAHVAWPNDVYPEQLCRDALKGLVDRKDRILKLALDEGKSKAFKDVLEISDSDPFVVQYRLIGFYPKHRIYVVREILSEATNDIIVAMRICTNCVAGGIQEFNLHGLAHFSPKGDYVVGIENGVAGISSDTGITIISLDLDVFNKVFSLYNVDNWEFVDWTNEKKLKVKTVQGETETHLYDATIVLSDDGRWRLHPYYK